MSNDTIPELPPMPRPDAYVSEIAEDRALMLTDEDDIGIALYLGPAMRDFGLACYRAGVAAGMEKAAKLCEQEGEPIDNEKPPGAYDCGCLDCAAAIRSTQE